MADRHYFLVEAWDAGAMLPEGCTAVALTQEAAYQLEQYGADYILMEEFYTSGEIRGDTGRFLNQQLDWFEAFDRFLQRRYPLAAQWDLKLASLYYYYLKYAIDNLILTTRIFKRFISTTHPAKLSFFSRKAGSETLEHILSFRNMQSTYSLLIDSVCAAEGIPLERRTLAACKLVTSATADQNCRHKGVKWLKPVLRRLRERYHHHKFLRPPLLNSHKKPVRVLLLHTAGFVFDFCTEARKLGFEFYVIENEALIKYTPFGAKRMVDINQAFRCNVAVDDVFIKTEAREALDRLYHWIDHQSDYPVKNALRSRMDKFIDDLCTEMVSLVPGFVDFYRRQRIDYVLTHSIWSLTDHAAIAAARKHPGTAGVGFAHGTDAFEAKSRFFKIHRLFDHLFVSTPEEVAHEREVVRSLNETRPILHGARYFRDQYRLPPVPRRARLSKLNTGKPVVVFVPVMCVPWPQRPIERTQPFPMEYMQWHKALAGFMAEQPDFHFIWKGLYQPNQHFDYMDEYISKKKISNIDFHADRLTKWLSIAHKVICDSPSTAFFEAIFLNLPVLSLYRPNDQSLRDNALKAYGNSLTPYSSVDEGLEAVGSFLDADPDDYIVSVPRTDDNVPDILRAAAGVRQVEQRLEAERMIDG